MARHVCAVNNYSQVFYAPDSLEPVAAVRNVSEGDMLGLAVDPAGLVLAPGQVEGCFTSQVISMPAFDWLVPSWSIAVPGESSVEIHFQVWTERSWSMWYPLGTWSGSPRSHEGKDDFGRVETDTLILKSPRSLVRYRLRLKGAQGKSPCLRRFDFVTRLSSRAESPVVPTTSTSPATPSGLLPGELPAGDLDLPVSPRSQMAENPSIASRICSPTSLAMALSFFGVEVPTERLAQLCYDHGTEIFGNWSFNASTLARFGLAGRVDWFGDFGRIARQLESGHPVIASVRFREGELEGAPIKSTAGHLILVRGFSRRDGKPYVVVNDPAAPVPESVRREYALDQFLKVWRGVVYIVEGADQGAGRESSALQWE